MTTDRARTLSTALTSDILPIALLTAVLIGLGFLVTRVLVHVWPFTIEDQAVRALVAARMPTLDHVSNLVSLIAHTVGLTAAAVGVYGGIAVVFTMHSRRMAQAVAWWFILLIIPVAVAISRVYRGEHHRSDVAASFIDGLGCLWILRRVILTPAEQRGSCEP